MASILRIFVSLPVCISCWTRCISIEYRKRSLLGDSFSPRKMEIFPGVTLQMHILALQAFVRKRISCSSLELYLLSFSAHGGTSSNVLGPLPLLFHKTLSKDSNLDLHERPVLRKGSANCLLAFCRLFLSKNYDIFYHSPCCLRQFFMLPLIR